MTHTQEEIRPKASQASTLAETERTGREHGRTPGSPTGALTAKSALTLVEVLVSLALIVMTTSLFLSSFGKARQSALLADDRMKAVHFARMNLETLLTNAYSSSNLSITNRRNWVTNSSLSGGVTSFYFCSYSVVTGQYKKSRTVFVTNSWYNLVSRKTNSVSLATSVCSGFQY
jgi:type II secretory pathway pseudopilin PulG